MSTPSIVPRTLYALPLSVALLLSLAACAGTTRDDASPGGVQAPVPRDQDPVMPAPTPPPSSSIAPAPVADDAMPPCNADAAQSFVGKPATEANVAAARSAAGAKGGVRVIAPGQVVTMDFRPDRLNIEVDAQRVIVTVRCG